ncbi:endonuclease/exonuclease/phosphatase family protein [Photobacterium sp. DNB22_13_2]
MEYHRLAFLLLIGMMPPLAHSFAKDNASELLTITTWNLNWLSDELPKEKNHANIPTRTTSDYQALASIINDISPDVFAFQEVANHQSLGKIISLNKYQIELSSRQTINNHEIWPQFIGFAIRKGIDYQRHPDLHQLDIWKNQYLRYGVDVSVYHNAKPSLRVLNVHLKSGCYNNRHRNKNCTVLLKQFKVLAKWISQRQAEKQPFVILGDFNRRLASKGDKHWQTLMTSVSSDPILMTKGIASQCSSQGYNRRKRQWEIRQYPEFIDHFIIDSRMTEKDNGVSFSEYLFSDQQLKQFQLSDHCPLSISLQL